MLNAWTVYQLSKIREKEILKEIEKNCLLRQSHCSRKTHKKGFRAFLNILGKILVSRATACKTVVEKQ